MFWRIGWSASCIHTSRIPTTVAVQYTGWQLHSLEHLCDLTKDNSVILIQNILTTNCYNNGRLCMNHVMIFGSVSVLCSFKLWKARWSFNISLTDSSISLSNLSIQRRNMSPSLTHHTSVMELRNLRWIRSLSQVIFLHPLIKQLHHHRVMREIRHTHLFSYHILPTSLHLIFGQIWLWLHRVVICILYHNLHLHTRMILEMILSCVLPF